MAAGGFVSRAFESMLKECGGKKHPDLQKAIQSYFGSYKLDFYFCNKMIVSDRDNSGDHCS